MKEGMKYCLRSWFRTSIWSSVYKLCSTSTWYPIARIRFARFFRKNMFPVGHFTMEFANYIGETSYALLSKKLVRNTSKWAALEKWSMTTIIAVSPWCTGKLTRKSIATCSQIELEVGIGCKRLVGALDKYGSLANLTSKNEISNVFFHVFLKSICCQTTIRFSNACMSTYKSIMEFL